MCIFIKSIFIYLKKFLSFSNVMERVFIIFLNNLKLFLICLFFSLNVFATSLSDRFSFNINGCMQADYLCWYGDDKHDELIYGGYLRSGDVFVNGFLVDKSIEYFFHLNLTDYLYENCFSQGFLTFSSKYFKFKIGQFLLPFGLEQACFLYDKMFLETSLINGMGEGKFFGVSFNLYSDHFCFFSSFVVPELKYSFNKNFNFRHIYSFRLFANFFRCDNFVLHLGIDYKKIKEDQRGNNPFKNIFYRDNPCFKARASLLNSYDGIIITSDIVDIEFSLMWRSLSFQTELGFVDVGWKDFDKEVYSSFYFQFSYIFSRLYRDYDKFNGCFNNPRILTKYGAVELLFKFCIVDMLNYGSLLMGCCQNDGRKESLLLGINWFVTDSLKLQLNCVVDEFMYRKSQGFQISGVGIRFQLVY